MSNDYVPFPLRDGPVVHAAAVQLVCDLEHRGIVITLDDNDVLTVRPRSALTDADLDALRRLKRHVVAILHYIEHPPAALTQGQHQ